MGHCAEEMPNYEAPCARKPRNRPPLRSPCAAGSMSPGHLESGEQSADSSWWK